MFVSNFKTQESVPKELDAPTSTLASAREATANMAVTRTAAILTKVKPSLPLDRDLDRPRQVSASRGGILAFVRKGGSRSVPTSTN